MLQTLIAIFSVVVVFGGILAFIYYAITAITPMVETVIAYANELISIFPDWVLPFAIIALVVAVVSLVVKFL